jgi:CheY-like chemotaxis protein/HPt (histidine-containing phosphotransfer) domain-containing protein
MSDLARRMSAARRVLIVGDPALSRSLMRMVLGRLDYVVTCAASAREAHAALAHTRFALALVALHLPDMSGLAFARALREADPEGTTPILLFGDAWDQEAVQQEARAAGLQGYLPKPISIARLVQTVRELTRQALLLDDPQQGMPGMPDEAATTTTAAPPIDLAHFESFTDGDAQLERELASIYLATAAAYLAEMREAAAAGEPWDRAAHSLKGASANIGARDVAALAKEAEHATALGSDELGRIEGALDAVRGFFEGRGIVAFAGREIALPELAATG